MGSTGLNGCVHTVRLRQHHQLLQSKTNHSRNQKKNVQRERALIYTHGHGVIHPGFKTQIRRHQKRGIRNRGIRKGGIRGVSEKVIHVLSNFFKKRP